MCGYTFTREKVEFQLGRALARIPLNVGIKPSTLQDVKAGGALCKVRCSTLLRALADLFVECVVGPFLGH
jgi:hypothetical protein